MSKQKHDKSDLHEIIPITFNMQEVLHARYNNIHVTEQERYFIQTRSLAKTSVTVLPKVQDIDKGVDPNLKP